MATIPRPTARRNAPVIHYAVYGDLGGTAELVCGSGYLFRRDGERQAILVHYTDPDLMLLGRTDLADMQRQADEAAGGFAALVCGKHM